MRPQKTRAVPGGPGTPPAQGVFAGIARRLTGFSLFVKVMGIALSLIALFGAETMIQTRALMRESMEKVLHGHSRLLARQLGSALTDPLITGDLFAASEALKAAAGVYPEVEYIFILSPQRRVLATTTAFPLSRALIDANAADADGAVREELFKTERGIIRDLAAPLMEGRLGTLRIGISREYRHRALNAMMNRLLWSGLLAALLGAAISYLLAFILVKPINDLMKGIDQVEKGDLNARVRPWFDDEIGRLTGAFNNMVSALGREKALKTGLVRKLIASQEEERQRISRELHDKTSQSLTSIKIGLKMLEAQPLPREALARCEDFRALLNSALDEIHELAVELRPPELGDLGLPQVVKELGENFRKTFGIKVECAIDEYFLANRLEAAVEIGLYRIIQEAFSNIEKHSGAGLVTVGFAKKSGAFLLTIRDDGCGFDNAWALGKPGRKPLGLSGMKERAEIFGGKFALVSKEGSGTEISVSIPAAG
ncbi:MAG: sensor histidine kinase [Elusimicrobia bacterium]|nr:sensor histidine kinase [Elusimicrobiota bacterium]